MVEAKLTNGMVYEGILTIFSPKMEICLEEVHDKTKVIDSAIVILHSTD